MVRAVKGRAFPSAHAEDEEHTEGDEHSEVEEHVEDEHAHSGFMVQVPVTHDIYIVYVDGITTEQWVLFEGRRFDILFKSI